MSRSNPTDSTPNPCTRWHEWDGTNGAVRYYDKTQEKNIVCKLPFTFILLDQLGTVKGWHDASDSGIFSNEVRDSKQEVMVVKSFKGGILAEGIYATIRDRIAAHGGHYTANCYIAFKNPELALGSIQFKGAALNAWVEFSKANRAALYKQGVKITGYTEGKKGKIVFRVPKFELVDISDKTNTEATTLDTILQQFLKGYFTRTRVEQVAKPAAPVVASEDEPPLTEPEGEMPPEDGNEPY